MSSTTKHKNPPWSLRRKLLLIGLPILIIIALALGLGLGLTLGRDDGDDNEPSPPTLTPLPTPNGTLTWLPDVNSTWQIILSHPPLPPSDTPLTPNVSIYDIDLFDTPKDTIQQLQVRGIKVVCYFSAGSYEEWRPDADDFEDADIGKELDGWPGEKWLAVGSENVRSIMKKRLEMAREKGCDGVDPDNVDGYQNENGLNLTAQDAIDYISYLSSIAVPLNLTLGLKNAGDIIPAVLPLVHFSVNEQCVEFSECATFAPFIAAGKPVFHIEYPNGAGEGDAAVQGLEKNVVEGICGGSDGVRTGKAKGAEGFSTVLKTMALGGWVEYCGGQVATTAVNETAGNHETMKRETNPLLR